MDELSRELDKLERILDGAQRPGKLNLSVLRHITANFLDDGKIGEGGCGHVYEGILPASGRIVAVKKLLNAKTMDDWMFQQEVTTMMSVGHHQNIVRILGYCSHIEERVIKMQGRPILVEERERLLCSEYMSNGSLADYVTDELRGLEWHTRFQIIKGICEGVRHLHQIGKNIIHMDLKPANILLDYDMVPKITDFGISRTGDISKTMSKERLCSLGYCAPEYLFNGMMSLKSDIYSLGVIIREMVTGRREEPNIATAHRRWRHRWKKSVKHTTLGYEQQVTKCLELAQRCQDRNPKERPNVQDIIGALNEMDNAARHISDATKSTVEQRNSFLQDMLGIEPLELHFSVELNQQISHSVKLSNDTDDYVAFRISIEEENIAFGASATGQLPFCMHPNKDVIPPRCSFITTITLGALKKPVQEEQYVVTELCVQSTGVDKDLTSNDITAEMFKEEPDKVIDMVNIKVSVRAPKQLLVVEPHELRYWPIEPNKLLPCSLQLTNRTDDYVAFTFMLPQGNKVVYYQAMGTGIMPPWSTRGVVVDMLVEEEALEDMKYKKDTCLLRSVVVDEGLSDDDVRVDMFYEQTGVQEVELDIVFAEQPQAPSFVRRLMYEQKQDWEYNESKLMVVGAALISPFSIETELLHIYPAELRFASEEGEEYITLINRTDDDVIYALNFDGRENERTADDTQKRRRLCSPNQHERCVGHVEPQSTHAVLVSFNKKRPYQVGVTMISGSRRYATDDDLYCSNYYYEKPYGQLINQVTRDKLINQVRAEGGKAHEAILSCVVRAPHPESMAANKQQHLILRMDENGVGDVRCMDVHPTEPWVVTGHCGGEVCIWKMDPKTSACETMLSSAPNSMISRIASSVKFIARMQWVACGDEAGCITIYTYADNRLTEIKKFQAHEDDNVRALAVHPTLPYVLSSSKGNLIKLWDWDQGWKCTRKFSFSTTDKLYGTCQLMFNPKDANSFASLDSEINIWSIHFEGPTTWCGRNTSAMCYCNTGSDLQCMATVSHGGCLQILDLRSNSTPVHEVIATRLSFGAWTTRFLSNHPTRPLLAAARPGTGVFLWNYATNGLKQVLTLNREDFENVHLGFIDIEGFRRLVIAHTNEIEMVDISDGPIFNQSY